MVVVGAPFAILGVLKGEDLERAVTTFPLEALAAATAIHLCWLCARSEAWRISLNAAGAPIPRQAAHGASAIGYAAGMIQSAGGLPVRAVALRKLAPQPPTIDRSMVAEAPVISLEAGVIALIFLAGVATTPVLPAWGAVAVLAASVLAVAAMAVAGRRYSGHRLTAGLRVFADGERRLALVGVVGVMTALGLSRAVTVLIGADLPHDAATIAILFAAMGLLGALPFGPGAAPAAMLAVLGPIDAAAAASAGLAVVASSLLAVGVYSAVMSAATAMASTRISDAACRAAASTSRSPVPPDPGR